jgi:hypothetical protein
MNFAADSVREYRDRYPYDGAGLLGSSASFADKEATRLEVSSPVAAALAADLVEDRLKRQELALIASLAAYAQRDL